MILRFWPYLRKEQKVNDMQKTIAKPVNFEGIGLHTGAKVHMRVLPAPIHSGISFVRTDLAPEIGRFDARFFNVGDTTLNTRLGGEHYVSTIEHLMAAFAGLGITNAEVFIDGPEVPIMDGSATAFVNGLWNANIVPQNASATLYRITKTVKVIDDDGAYAQLSPSNHFTIGFEIDFPNTAIGHQMVKFDMANGLFVRELANCRTFCRKQEVDMLHERGLGLGGSLDNAVVIDGNQVLNPDGFRRSDEAVRHKVLDALGDLYLIGGFISGEYTGYKAGHRLTNQLLRKVFAENAVEKSSIASNYVSKLPGYQVVTSDFC